MTAASALATLGADALERGIDAALREVGGGDDVREAVTRRLRPRAGSATEAAGASFPLGAVYRSAERLHRRGMAHRLRALSSDEYDDLRLLLQTDHLAPLLELLQTHDAAFGEALLDVYRQAAKEGVEQAVYRERLLDVARRWGAGDWKAGAIAQTWQAGAVEVPLATAGKLLTYRVPEIAAETPYIEILTRDDGRVRPNHAKLHGFVVAVTWEGMAEILPPYGYNCRCQPYRRTVAELEARFGTLTSGNFPFGSAKLDAFRSAGGADEGFPRSLFVLAA